MIIRTPAVSVLLPVRAGGPLLLAAVGSILRQSVTDLELIVVDDGGNEPLLRELPRDPRLRVVANAGSGLVAALNTAAGAARADYLARMDADDIALPVRLERQLGLLEAEPELGLVGAQVEIFTDAGTVLPGFQRYQAWLNSLTTDASIRREMFIESPIPHPTAVLRRSVFQRMGGYRNPPWAEDYDLWLRAYQTGINMAKPSGILLRWRDRPARLTRTDSRYSPRRFVQAKAYYLRRTVLRRRAAVIWGAAPTGAALCDALVAAGVRVRAFIDIDPKKIGGRKRARPVWPPQAAAAVDDELILGAVGARGARADIRAALQAMDKQEGPDFLFTA